MTDTNGDVATDVLSSPTPGALEVVASPPNAALSATAKLFINTEPTTLSLSVAAMPVAFGNSTQLTAVAQSARGCATGPVTFAIDGVAVATQDLDATTTAIISTPCTRRVGHRTVTVHLEETGALGAADAPQAALEITGWVMSGDGGCGQSRDPSDAGVGDVLYGVAFVCWLLWRRQRAVSSHHRPSAGWERPSWCVLPSCHPVMHRMRRPRRCRCCAACG